MHKLEIQSGATVTLPIAVGVGAPIAWEGTGQDFEFKIPHCLQEGDNVLLCQVPETCNRLEFGECVVVEKVLNAKAVQLNITVPNDAEGTLIKAAKLDGFHAVARFGEPSEERYLNYIRTCAGDAEALIEGCFPVPPGSKLRGGKAYPQPTPIVTHLAGKDGAQQYTIFVLDSPAAVTHTPDDRQFAILSTPEQIEVHSPAHCGIFNLAISPEITKALPKGCSVPFSVSIERGWDMSEYNKRHGTNCPWKPDFSQPIYTGIAEVR